MYKVIIWLMAAMMAITACNPAVGLPGKPAELTHIDLGVGYVPNVQFAPYYVAQAKGFYAEEGLDVALEYGFENDFVTLTAQGSRQFAVASGDQVILAGSQGLPVVYVMKWYQQYPVGVVTTLDSGITTPQQLVGHSVGIPGMYGASYVGWKALTYAANLDETKITMQEIGFTQSEALSQGKIDAAVIYIANEPIQLAQNGVKVQVIKASDYLDLVSNGLVTNQTLIEKNPDLVRRMVRASLRGIAYTIAHPDEAFTIVRAVIPEMTDADAPTQRAVLDASIELWRTDQPGVSSPEAWQTSANFMQESGLLKSAVTVDSLYTNTFVK